MLTFTVRTKQDLIDAVERYGFLPLFANGIPGSFRKRRRRPCGGCWDKAKIAGSKPRMCI